MALARHTAFNVTRRLVRPAQRRFAGHDAHGHSTTEPVNESLGPMLYGAVAFVPTVWLLYELSQSSDDTEPFFTRMIRKFDSWQDVYKERNILHANAVQKAADDNILFNNSGAHAVRRRVPVRNIESINVYSTQSVQPGWGSIDLTKLVEHIHAENEQTEASNKARYEGRVADGYYTKEE